MLIACERHRSEDLLLWSEMEEADRVHGRRLAAKAARSLDAIRDFAAAGPCYASISWGKDSVTLAHLVWLSEAPVLLWHYRGAISYNPYTELVRDAFLARFDVEYGEVFPEYDPEWSEARIDAAFVRCLGMAGDRYLSGIRAGESFGRRVRMRRHGLATMRTCAPLGWWTVQDVFGWLAVHDLPVHPNYAMLGGGRWPREHLRVSALTGTRGDQFGRAEWEKEYYGDVLWRTTVKSVRPS